MSQDFKNFTEICKPFIELFDNFNRESKPVLWSILLTQARIYKALINRAELEKPMIKDIQPWQRLFRQDDKVLEVYESAVENYLKTKLENYVKVELASQEVL